MYCFARLGLKIDLEGALKDLSGLGWAAAAAKGFGGGRLDGEEDFAKKRSSQSVPVVSLKRSLEVMQGDILILLRWEICAKGLVLSTRS